MMMMMMTKKKKKKKRRRRRRRRKEEEEEEEETGEVLTDAYDANQVSVQVAQSVKLPLFTLHCDITVPNTLKHQILCLDKDAHWIPHEPGCVLQHLLGQGRAEQTNLHLRRQHLENVVHSVTEIAAQQLISLVHNEVFDTPAIQLATPQQITHTARIAHNDVHTASERCDILAHRGPAYA